MRPVFLLSALALLTPLAHAGSLPPASTSVPGASASLPLYGGVESTDPYLYVEARVGDQALLLRLDSGSSEVHISEAAAGRIGLKKSKSTTKANGEIASLAFGEVRLERVAVWVDGAAKPAGVLPVDGSVGLLAFPNVSWAVLPSQGKVELRPAATAASGAAAAVGPASPQAAELASRKQKVGHAKVELRNDAVVLPVTVSGVTLPARWLTAAPSTVVAREVDGSDYALAGVDKKPTPLPAAAGYWDGTVKVEARDVNGVSVAVRRDGQGSEWLVRDNAEVGIDVAQRFDLTVDNAAHTAAVTRAATVQKADYADTLEARLKAAITTASAAPAEGPAPTPEELQKKRAGALAPYAAFLEARGRGTEAAPLRKEIAEASPDDCAGWTTYGQTLLALGDGAGAVTAFTRADALYTPWATQALDARKQIEADKAKAEKAKKDWTGAIPQSHTCHVAVGGLAAAKLLEGDLDGVQALYARLDLDGGLARTAGIAALKQGKADDAQAAFRQAQKLHGVGDDDGARIGLFLAYQKSNPTLAQEQLTKTRFQYDGRTDALTLRLWAEGLRASGGSVAALTQLSGMLPGDAVVLAQLAAEQRAAGVDAAPTALKALAAFDAALEASPRDGRAWADYALFLVAEGKQPEARKAADLAVLFAPEAGSAWLAAAACDEAAGNATAAAEHRRKAAAVGHAHPGYATLAAK